MALMALALVGSGAGVFMVVDVVGFALGVGGGFGVVCGGMGGLWVWICVPFGWVLAFGCGVAFAFMAGCVLVCGGMAGLWVWICVPFG